MEFLILFLGFNTHEQEMELEVLLCLASGLEGRTGVNIYMSH